MFTKEEILRNKAMFPSPCGEKVGINRISSAVYITDSSPFPSPCGEKVGINPRMGGPTHPGQLVSVPLRGKGRDQRWQRLFAPNEVTR